VELSADGGITWSAAKSTSLLSTTESVLEVGSPNDTWGRSWNGNQVNGNNLRVRITMNAASTARDFYLDYVAVNVWYTP
jgi:hypothetical protein